MALASHYVAMIRKRADTDYGVEFPDFDGIATGGTTLDEAMAAAREALALHIDAMIDDDEPIPAPSSIDEIVGDPYYREDVAVLVAAPPGKPRYKRIAITVEESLLDAVDAAAKAAGESRSGFLAGAARERMERRV